LVKVSIIVPIYKVEKYLDKCIQSILSQTFKDFELILVDDGSPDKCGIMCDNYANVDRRVKVIHKENGGLSSARNRGLNIASGKYIAFVDSDDWIEKSMYEALYTMAEQYDADIVQCNYVKAFNENIGLGNNGGSIRILDNFKALENLFNENASQAVVTWNKIYKKYLFNDVTFPVGKIHEDNFTTYKLLYKSKKVVLLDEMLYYYRQTPNSIMNSPFSERNLDAITATEETLKFFKKIKNNKLHSKALMKYEAQLKFFYFKCENLPKNKQYTIKEQLKKKYNSIFYEYLLNDGVQIKKKLISSTFFVSPKIYKGIQKLRGKMID